MNFISPLLGNIPLSLEVSSCVVNLVSGSYDINISYTDSASGNSSVFLIRTPLYANGNYPWNGSTSTISGNVYYGGLLYTVQQDGSGGSTKIKSDSGYWRKHCRNPLVVPYFARRCRYSGNLICFLRCSSK
ncbi:MAG: hypothetical protein IPM91_08670 [Bacteroidetes bacterium]|nr:hypothetical protein [Bacteroidota bacterium]